MTVTDDAATVAIDHLTRLGELLNRQDLLARVRVAHRRPPELHVVNPEAPVLFESVHAAPHRGDWWYWWSWAEPIVPAADLETAASRVRHVLTPQGR
ncbi:hypothetical protein FHS43_000905 [Streptosporangium becharense]|uniref:Uncharacterized protein n=1 Tax=Streptosporangium becharense TaxID=1816182 RepID=A0A7W9MG14_9ACTN|nr:hypothetical protein [Streptosporangium becharense]MBB2909659.1 hypothetical protein [Streptosporangium becharense]MBB5819385.1 hypothetical protein [Streptosporangium becharense]